MIEFLRDGTDVLVRVDTGAGMNICFTFQCGSVLYATLLRQQLADKYMRETEAFARKNYEEGWKDKLKRQIKRVFHPSKM